MSLGRAPRSDDLGHDGAGRPNWFRVWRWPLVLFLLTALTTTWAQGPGASATWQQGAAYSVTLLSILVAHEMGHFVTARRYGMPASPPHFIPLPLFLGTLGAVIRMDGRGADRGQLLTVGAAGPLAGFIVAVPAMLLGLSWSTPTAIGADQQGGVLYFGYSLLSWALEHWLGPELGPGQELIAHPVYIAAWAGFLVTALNLLPMGQLDGGHVVHALWPESSARVAYLVQRTLAVVGLLGLVVVSASAVDPQLGVSLNFMRPWLSPSLLFWALLVGWMGLEHPPVSRSERPPRGGHWVLAGACAVVLALSFMPSPLYSLAAPVSVSADSSA